MSTNQLRNPATGEPVADLENHSRHEFARKLTAAREAQPAWAALGVKARGRVILRLRRLISERRHEIASLVSLCTGKTRSDAMSGEVAPVGMAAGWYPRVARQVMRRQPVRPRQPFFALIKRSHLVREPLGVVGIISPWNYPFGIPMHEIMMALVTGNTVVIKVATQVQPVGEMMCDLVRSAGVPADAIQLVHLTGSEAGEAFLGADIDKLHFTGSTGVGKQLAAAAGDRLLPVGLELGGNDAMIVLDNANVERAANAVLWAGLSNAGQSCGGVERIIAERGIYDRLRDRIAAKVTALRVGPDENHAVDLGSLTTESQADLVRAHVADALEKGATVVAEAGEANGLVHPVVVLENVDDSMDVVQHETFGPVVTIERASDENDAIARANDSYLGLSASVWSGNAARARRVAGRVQAGSIAINDHLMQHGMAETPWGGYKESSMGRTHGRAGLESMTKLKVIVESRFRGSPHQIWWMPNGEAAYQSVSSILPLLYGPGRLRAAARLIPAFLRSLFRTPKAGE